MKNRMLAVLSAAAAAAFLAFSARADIAEEPLLNPDDPTDVWGKKITGLGENGDETALVFTKTGATMNWTLPEGVKSIWYLVVGGGGSGGTSYADGNGGGGGGGAGGMLEEQDVAVLSRDIFVSVGKGGAAVSGTSNNKSSRPAGNTGDNSSLTIDGVAITAHGGGGGGGCGDTAGKKGGSGGGAYAAGTVGACYDGEGNEGGHNTASSGKRGGGGGGGAGGAGGSVTSSIGAAGGPGKTSAIGAGRIALVQDEDGNDYYCAGGGGGGADTKSGGAGGVGGGGKGNVYNGSSATTSDSGLNYGCGGGGTQGNQWKTHTSGAGYQGVVVVRYRVLAANEVPVPTIEGKTYNGELQKADIADGEGYYVAANEGGVNAGDYVVTVTPSNGYQWVGGSRSSLDLTFTITKADNSWSVQPALSKTSWKYSDDPAEVTPGVDANGTEATVSYENGEVTMPADVGGHTATFTVPESKNYKELTKSISFTIEKDANAWVTEPFVTPAEWVTGETPGVFAEPLATYGEVTVVYDGDVVKTEPDIVTLGTHEVVYTVAEGETYLGLSKTVSYEITKKVNGWKTDPVVPTSFNIEDPVPAFVPPTADHGEVDYYFDGDQSKKDIPTDIGKHRVTYVVAEDDDYQKFERTYFFDVIYKPLLDPNDTSKAFGYRIPALGENQNEVALVFTNTSYTAESPIRYTLPSLVTSVSYLVVGGGASGGATQNRYGAGGGGAGGVVTNEGPCAVEGGATLTVVVGKGGGAVSLGEGNDGGPSLMTLGTLEAKAFKGAGGGYGTGSNTPNGRGGSEVAGGGGAGCGANAGSGGVGAVSKGGDGTKGTTYKGGGGGGAGGDGAVYSDGLGGVGVGVTIFDQVFNGKDEEIYMIAAGGSGSTQSGNNGSAAGGGGRGGNGTQDAPTAGTRWGAGGGGASGGSSMKATISGAGHQGVVVVRYVEPQGVATLPIVSGKVYTGETLVAEPVGGQGWTVVANEGGTDVGEYAVTFGLADGYTSWDGGSTGAQQLPFAITPAQNEWTVDPAITKVTWLTTDEPGVLTAGETKFGTPTATIAKDEGEGVSFGGTLPTDPGDYVITYTVEASDNWVDPEVVAKSVSFKIVDDNVVPPFTVTKGAMTTVVGDGKVDLSVGYAVHCEVESSKKVDIYAYIAEDGADSTNEVKIAEGVALDAVGVGTISDLKPGATYWVALGGRGGDTVAPMTEFTPVTVAGPAMGLTASATFTNNPKEFVIAGSVTPGLGTTTVYLRWSLNSDALDQSQTFAFAFGDIGAFEQKMAYENATDTLTWDVAVSNSFMSTTYGEQKWDAALPVSTKKRADSVATTYTWTGAGEDNNWANPENWSADKPESYGYPNSKSYATAKFTKAATVDLDGGTFGLVAEGLKFSTNLGEVTLRNGTISVPFENFGYGANGTTVIFDSVTISGQKGLNFTKGATVVFKGTTSQDWQYEPWDVQNGTTTLKFCDGLISSGYFQTWIRDTHDHRVYIDNAVWTITKASGTMGTKFYLLDGADRQAQLVSQDSLSLAGTWYIPIPADGHKKASIVGKTAANMGGTFQLELKDWVRGKRVPLVTYTGAKQTSVIQALLDAGSLRLNLLVDGKAEDAEAAALRNGHLEWDEATNTLYYKQNGKFGFTVIVK